MEVSKAARQRCADLSNEVRKERGNSPAFYAANCFGGGDMAESVAFARFVQQTSDTMREIVRLIGLFNAIGLSTSQRLILEDIKPLARPFILPEPVVDPLVEAVKTVLAGFETDGHAQKYANEIRAHLAKSGKVIKIEEAE